MEDLLTVGRVFLFGVIIDVMWVLYILATSQKRIFLAALVSMAMAVPAIFGIVEIVDDKIMAIPYVLGLGCGTVAGLKLHDRLISDKDVQ